MEGLLFAFWGITNMVDLVQGVSGAGWKVGQGCKDEHRMPSALKGLGGDRCARAGIQRTGNCSLPSKQSAPQKRGSVNNGKVPRDVHSVKGAQKRK